MPETQEVLIRLRILGVQGRLIENTRFSGLFENVVMKNLTAQSLLSLLMALFVAALAVPLPAQSPNTGSMTVVVVDQSDAVVKDAKVTVVNAATGAAREAFSGSDGSVIIPALSLTGTYTVKVSKAGFGDEQAGDIELRAGDTAMVRVKMLVGSASAAGDPTTCYALVYPVVFLLAPCESSLG
jgi:hypothetical protein